MKNKKPFTWFKLFCLCIVSGTSCVQYHPKAVNRPQPESWKNASTNEAESPPLPTASYEGVSKWWEIFEDQKLTELEEQALAQSPSLKLAVARLREAKGLYTTIRSDMFPQLNLGMSAERQHFSADQVASTPGGTAQVPTGTAAPLGLFSKDGSTTSTPTPTPVPAPAVASAPKTSTSQLRSNGVTRTFLQVVPELSYEVDFWGKYSQATQSASAHAKGVEEALRTAYIILTINVAQTYFEIRAADADIAVLHTTIEDYEEQVALNKDRYISGIVSDLDVLQAEVELSKNQQELESAINERALAENLLATLLGIPASSFSLEVASFKPALPNIPVGMPADLLKKRPDIRQSEFDLEASRLDVGVAKTAFFPAIMLNGTAGYEAAKFHNLFKWRNHIWSATASLLQPIFDGGKNYGNLVQAKARYQQNVANFLNTVVQAFQDVEDSLNTIDAAKKRSLFSEAEFKSADKLSHLTFLQYKSGIVDYLNVIQAEFSALQAERDTIQTKKERVIATLSLIKSLGGTW